MTWLARHAAMLDGIACGWNAALWVPLLLDRDHTVVYGLLFGVGLLLIAAVQAVQRIASIREHLE